MVTDQRVQVDMDSFLKQQVPLHKGNNEIKTSWQTTSPSFSRKEQNNTSMKVRNEITSGRGRNVHEVRDARSVLPQ